MELQTTEEAADMLRLSRRTLERWRVTGEGPAFFKMGNRVSYRLSDIEAWVAARVVGSTSELRS
jgi:excisionase family DNA binding protein